VGAVAPKKSRGRSVGIATRLRAGRWSGARISPGKDFYSNTPRPPSLLFSGYHGSFLGVERPGREVDFSHASSAQNEWSCTSMPSICLHGVTREHSRYVCTNY
jgi:hypothetical protein